jgi:hypothetical protein
MTDRDPEIEEIVARRRAGEQLAPVALLQQTATIKFSALCEGVMDGH